MEVHVTEKVREESGKDIGEECWSLQNNHVCSEGGNMDINTDVVIVGTGVAGLF